MEHQDVTSTANIDKNWHPTIQSRYGATIFTNYDPATSVLGTNVRLKSELENGEGFHKVDGTMLSPTQPSVPAFWFDGTQPIIIGKSTGGRPWNLNIIIIDPPSPYS